ncbi:LOW QUALITY PROTEIN: hypothetical protein QYF61_010976 [Mycteria americana]|uniref:Uncharacterized protein n=1 Tax=Mycteria americana TaxID=33587 RepID=A0AAN7NFI1_MYCAM|nr:LOW QUALITY PROTEIN: hypothetical protein QYF61_010976 [Mycteria americana]
MEQRKDRDVTNVAQSPIQPDLECFQGWSIYHLSGQPVPPEQPQLSQPVLIGEVLQLSDHFRGPPLDPLQQLHVLLVLRAPELDAVLQVGSHQSRAEGQNHLPRPAGHASLDAAQDTAGLLGCERTLLGHVQLFIHQYPKVLLRRAALDHIIPQPVLKPRIAPTQDPALGLAEPHEVHPGPLLQLVQVALDDIPSFWRVSCTTQLGVICKLAEGALNITVNVIDENIQQHWSQYGPLRGTTPVDCYPLGATIQPIPYPLNSPPIKSISLQFREKDVVGDRVKGFTEVQIDDIHCFFPLSTDVPAPVLDNPFGEKFFPNIQSKPPRRNLSLFPLVLSLVTWEKRLTPTSLQPQTLHQLHCRSLDTLQHLNVFLVVRGPKLNTVFECRVQRDNRFPSAAGHTSSDTSQDAIGLLGHLGTLPAHIQLAIDQHPRVLFHQAALQA